MIVHHIEHVIVIVIVIAIRQAGQAELSASPTDETAVSLTS